MSSEYAIFYNSTLTGNDPWILARMYHFTFELFNKCIAFFLKNQMKKISIKKSNWKKMLCGTIQIINIFGWYVYNFFEKQFMLTRKQKMLGKNKIC